MRRSVSRTRGRRTKKTYAKFAARSKGVAKKIRRTARAKPRTKRGASVIKKQVLANAKAIQSLKVKDYGPKQSNWSITKTDGLAVSKEMPRCFHLNNLHASGDVASRLIRCTDLTVNDFAGSSWTEDEFFRELRPPGYGPERQLQVPNGDRILWLYTRLEFEIQAWVDRTNVDIWIVKERKGVMGLRSQDPWMSDQHSGISAHPRQMPYSLPMFKDVTVAPGSLTTNWLDPKRFRVLKRKRIYINSVPAIPPHTAVKEATDALKETASHPLHPDNDMTQATLATTGAVRKCSITLKPNMVLKQLYPAFDAKGVELPRFDANMHDNRQGSYRFDNFRPDQNIWCVITTSDPYQNVIDSNIMNPEHVVKVKCKRTNVWRDKLITEDTTRANTGQHRHNANTVSYTHLTLPTKG